MVLGAIVYGPASQVFGQEKGAMLEEITVTAQKREESLNDVSLSVTAFSGQQVRDLRINQPLDLASHTPGLTVATTNGDANPIFSLRGIGLLDFPANSNPAVSVYVDEVFVPSHAMIGFQLFDLERVEVLKGPQGTLYGRNTTGGAINFITRKPQPGEAFNGFARVDYGSFSEIEAEGAVGGTLGDDFAGRIAFITKQRMSGYQRNRLTGEEHGELDRTAIRGLLSWTPTENLDVLVNFHGAVEDSDSQYYDFHGFADPNTFGPCATRLAPNPNGCVDFFGNTEPEGSPFNVSVSELFGHFIDSSAVGGYVRVNWDLPRFSVTSITAYDRFQRVLTEDFDASQHIQFDDMYRNNVWIASEELRLTSDESWPIDWLLGFYYSTDTVKGLSLFALDDFGAGRLDSRWKQKTETVAGFGHFEWPITEQWQVVGGIRYTYEEKEFAGGSGLGSVPTAFLLSFTNDAIDESDVSGEIGLEFRPKDDWLIYAKWGRGFKSGGFDGGFTSSNAELVPVDPEEVFALEGGFKASLLDRTMQLNAAAYYYEWNDFQTQISLLRGGIPQLVLGNAGDVEIIGIESELIWNPVRGLDLHFGMNYFEKAEIVDSLDASLIGNAPPNTPELMVNGLMRYTHPFDLAGYDLNAFGQFDFSYKDSIFFEPANRVTVDAESYWLFNTRFGLTTEDERVEVAIWGRNLTDEEYRIGGNTGADFTADVFYYGLPRTVGVSVTYRFE